MMNVTLDFKYEDVLARFNTSLQKKITHSVELLRKAERLAMAYDSEYGYYLAFSGGKDSQCLYHVAKLAGVKFKAHMNLTSVDPPEVIRFVKTKYPDVELIKPKDSIFNIAVKKQILPTMRVRWCCAEYKETAGAGKVTLIGIRKAESSRRAKRNEVEINNHSFSGDLIGLEAYRKEKTEKAKRRKSDPKNSQVTIVNADGERTLGCIHGKESLLISPIIHWTDADVWTFLNTLCIAHCELYDQGFTRIGCVLCPMSQLKQKYKEMERWPHVKRNWIKAIKAIRMGGVFKSEYIWWNIRKDWIPLKNVRGLLRMSRGGLSEIRTPDTLSQRTGCKCHLNSYQKDIWRALPQSRMERDVERYIGFSGSSSSDRLTEEQENEIAENIFDWWISGKPYKQWYAEKFCQLKLDFKDEE